MSEDDTPDFEQLLALGEEVATLSTGRAQLQKRSLGSIAIDDGNVYACDPFVPMDDVPFARVVSPGTYEVALLFAVSCDKAAVDLADEETLAAMLILSNAAPNSWEVARRRGSDSDASGEQRGAYGVDSGTGCFMGQRAAQRILAGPGMSEASQDKLYATYAATGPGCVELTDGVAVALFRSGSGDGVYESWWGLDDDGHPAVLLTDFATLAPVERVEEVLAERRRRASKPWWQFWS